MGYVKGKVEARSDEILDFGKKLVSLRLTEVLGQLALSKEDF